MDKKKQDCFGRNIFMEIKEKEGPGLVQVRAVNSAGTFQRFGAD